MRRLLEIGEVIQAGDIYMLDGGREDYVCKTIGSRMRQEDSPIYRIEPDGRAEIREDLETLLDAPWANLCGRAQEIIEGVIAKLKGETP